MHAVRFSSLCRCSPQHVLDSACDPSSFISHPSSLIVHREAGSAARESCDESQHSKKTPPQHLVVVAGLTTIFCASGRLDDCANVCILTAGAASVGNASRPKAGGIRQGEIVSPALSPFA